MFLIESGNDKNNRRISSHNSSHKYLCAILANCIRRLLLWLPALMWYRVIWSFSAQSASVSGDLLDRLLSLLFSPAMVPAAGLLALLSYLLVAIPHLIADRISENS